MLAQRSNHLRPFVVLVLFAFFITLFTECTAEAARRGGRRVRGGGGRRAAFGRRFNPGRRRVAVGRRNNNGGRRNNNNNNNIRRRAELGGQGLILGDNQVDAFTSLAIDPTGQRFNQDGLSLVSNNIAVDQFGRAFLVDPRNINRNNQLTVFQDQILGGNSNISLNGDIADQARRINNIGVSRAASLVALPAP